ncbi:MAG: ATP-binding protein [Acidobacteria bacterium]|jgi:serine/threonine-protein kinase RsbW|nr:ATP-binding protein [Acidobacteriota bacterium]
MSQDDRIPCVEFDRDRLEPRLSLEIPGQVESISPAVEEILAVTERMGCTAGREFEVETSLREALANAIRHGCERDPNKKVQVCVACDDARGMLIVVRDPGPGFDPESIPSPVQGENLFTQGGRGIFLINELMDEVSIERGGTEIRMLKR